jgi:hypothetical protein
VVLAVLPLVVLVVLGQTTEHPLPQTQQVVVVEVVVLLEQTKAQLVLVAVAVLASSM